MGNFDDFKYLIDKILYDLDYYRNLRIDFIDLLHQIHFLESDIEAKEKIDIVISSYEKVLVNEHHGEFVDFSNGISIYLPIPTVENYNNYYSSDELGLLFVKDTHWDELIENYYETSGLERINIIPEIPDLLME